MDVHTILVKLHQRPIAYYPIYRKITGSTTAGILLSQLMYWWAKMDGEKFYKTDAEIKEETLLTDNELRGAKDCLKKMSFLKITVEGVPAKTFYEIDGANLFSEINETGLVESTKQGELNQLNSKEHKNTQETTQKKSLKENPIQPKEFRKAVFEKSLIPYLETYGKEILRAFSDYWTESNENGNKMRFEMQKVFDKSRRLATWHKNSKDFKNAPLIPSEQKDIETIAAFFKATWHTPNPELVKELAPKIKQILQSGETMESLQRNIGMSRKVASVWGSFDFLINNYPKLKTICERYTSQNLA